VDSDEAASQRLFRLLASMVAPMRLLVNAQICTSEVEHHALFFGALMGCLKLVMRQIWVQADYGFPVGSHSIVIFLQKRFPLSTFDLGLWLHKTVDRKAAQSVS
jgi:hypothetical protein